jgi:hypothetical protein
MSKFDKRLNNNATYEFGDKPSISLVEEMCNVFFSQFLALAAPKRGQAINVRTFDKRLAKAPKKQAEKSKER